MKKFKFILMMMLLSIFLVGCGSSDKPFSELSTEDKESYVWVMTQDVIQSQLKSPSSAIFPDQPQVVIDDLGNNKFEISGYVEAENSFGASIKTPFTVTLTVNETYNEEHNGYGYTVDECVIE